mmetsp:Transcript_3214/g.7164  ORF Transcript_3214/g.7164 Transcript_3214/m.7164 type:complete len:244 (+) Transcript_3214:272-1003(+)
MAAGYFLLAFLLSCNSDAFLIGGPSPDLNRGTGRSFNPLRMSDIDIDDLEHYFISDSTVAWVQKMATSYLIERGESLIEVITREGSCVGDDASCQRDDERLRLARTCARTNLAIGSHDFLRSDEAIYCYGNKSFLTGFGYDWAEFVELPSRKCVASDKDVVERQKLLDLRLNAVCSDDDLYNNLIRVRKDGGRLLLTGVHLWNVYDVEDTTEDCYIIKKRAEVEDGMLKAIGQAVWIKNVEFL